MIHNGTDTSIAAARFIAPHAPSQRERVFAYIHGRGMAGATINEIADQLDMRAASVCARVAELRGEAYGNHQPMEQRIYDSGLRRKYQKGDCAGKVWMSVRGDCNQPTKDTP